MHFRKIRIHFGKIGIRNGYVFATSMARPRPKSGQVPPPVGLTLVESYLVVLRSFLVSRSKGT